MASIVISDSGSESEGESFQPFSLQSTQSAGCSTSRLLGTAAQAVTSVDEERTKKGKKRKSEDEQIAKAQGKLEEMRKRRREGKKQAEQLMKKMGPQMEAATKKAAGRSRRGSRPAEPLKQMVVLIDTSLSENPEFMEVLARELREAGVDYRVSPGEQLAGSVRWRRKQWERAADDTAQVTETVTEVHEKELLVTLEGQGFASLVYYTKQLQKGLSLPPHARSLRQYVEQIRRDHSGVNVSLAVDGMEAFFRGRKTRLNRQFRQAVLGSADTSPPSSAILSEVTRLDCQEAIVGLGLETGCLVRLCPGGEELAKYVFALTKALAEKPSRKDGPFSFHADVAVVNKKKAEDSANQLATTWKNQLMQLNNMSDPMASAVVSVYPSPSHLLSAYASCPDKSSAELLLQNIMVRRGVGTVASTRKIGPVQSQRIYTLLTSRDPQKTLT